MKYLKIIWLTSFFIISIVLQVNGQMAGSPVGVRGQGEWSVSAEATYVDQGLSSERVISRRLLLKSLWGDTMVRFLYHGRRISAFIGYG